MKIEQREFEVQVPKADGKSLAKQIVTIPVRWDEEIQAWLITQEGQQTIDDTKAQLAGLLLPYEFKELRKRYGYSQSLMGELFQVGEKSWNRWETGNQRPSRSINLLIRALYDGEISINYLLKRAGKEPSKATTEPEIPEQLQCEPVPAFDWINLIKANLEQTNLADAISILYSSPVNPDVVSNHISTGKQAFLKKVIEAVETNAECGEMFSKNPHAGRMRFNIEAPSHTYNQPRLIKGPTVA
jgi:DNA-binding transcriptional regulator YiaG